MKRLAIVFASLLVLTILNACANGPKAPEGHVSFINSKPKSGLPARLEFTVPDDFDSDGRLKAGSKGVIKTTTFEDLHKWWCMDAATKESIQAFALEWKQRYQQLQKTCK